MKKGYRWYLEDTIRNIARKWGQSGVYYVGGYVRDEIMNAGVGDDVDLVIDLPDGAQKFVEFLKSEYPDSCVDFVEYPRYGTAKFTLKFDMKNQNGKPWTREVPIECVEPRKEEYNDGPRKPSKVSSASIEEDAKRRDFCCNALYKDSITGKVLDPTGHGLEDIKNRILRTPTDPEITFKDDPLRMLRAIRFAAVKGFEIEEKTYEALKPIPEYYQLSMERVRTEFTKILLSGGSWKHIRTLHSTGLLDYIIPELEEGWGFNQNSKYHSMNLSDHLLSVLENSVVYLKGSAGLSVRMAALLHDISKYRYHEIKPDGTFSYHDHETKSSEMAEKIMRRLTYSNDVIEETCLLIKNHMALKSQYDYSTDTYNGTKKSIVKFLNKIEYDKRGNGFLEQILALINADNLSHAPQWNMPGQIKSLTEKMEKYKISGMYYPLQMRRRKPTTVQISGDDIMKRFNLPPGKTIGFIKDLLLNEFAVDHPDYDKETLLNMYEEEFGDKMVYLDKGEKTAAMDLSMISQYSRESIQLFDNEISDLFKRYSSDIDPTEPNRLSIPAIKEPELWMKIATNINALKLVEDAMDSLGKLAQLPGFENIKLEYDNCNDLGIVINWKGRRPTSIF